MALKFTDPLWLPGGEKGHVVAADGKRACHVFQTQPRLEKEAPGDDSACATASNRDRGWRRSGGRPHGESGGIVVFLCSNLGNGPAGTQACPAAPATITGTLRAADVIGPAGQGIAAGEFAEFLAAIRAGVTYVNIHSSIYPGGEIRAQISG